MRDRDSSWAAAVTLAGREYESKLDAERLGLHPYLPQMRKSWLPRGATKPMLRSVPLFPRYFFIPLQEARARQLHHVRGLCGHQYLLASAEGRIWEAPGLVIAKLAQAEKEGRFDEVPPELGDKVRLRSSGVLSAMDLVVASLDEKTAQLFSPLFGGVKASAKVPIWREPVEMSDLLPWVDVKRIRASIAKDVVERVLDDRTSWEPSADATEVHARMRAATRVKWKFTLSPRAAAKPKIPPSAESGPRCEKI
jgi:hypothetical protein